MNRLRRLFVASPDESLPDASRGAGGGPLFRTARYSGPPVIPDRRYSGPMEAVGRWNPIGTPMLCTAQHLSLACVEILVHLDKSELPRDYVWSSTDLREIPEFLQFKDLNHVWSCQLAGHWWVQTAGQLAIQVPSVVIPEEFNILLNPLHPHYAQLVWSDPRRLRFDPRLFNSEPRTL